VCALKAGWQLQKGSLHLRFQGPLLQTPALVSALRLFALEGAGGGDQACEAHSPSCGEGAVANEWFGRLKNHCQRCVQEIILIRIYKV